MPTPTYIPLASLTLSSSAASVTFSSISQAYRDLVLIVDATTSSQAVVRLRFNSNANSSYSYVYAQGDGSSASSYTLTETSADAFRIPFETSVGTIGRTNIMDYSATDKHKTLLGRGDRAQLNGTAMITNRWANTAAITSIVVFPQSASWTAGSTFALYGIAA